RLLDAGTPSRAGYGEATVVRLADELGMQHRTLEQAVQFARQYPKLPKALLSWAHYRELIRVSELAERRWYERRALAQSWTKRQLVERIREETYAQEAEAEGGGKGPGGARRGASKLARPTAATHVYKAEVERVIDGDTLLLRVDLGFEVWKEQRLRLAGVDAAPLDTPDGKKAWAFVVERLAAAEQVVVKTSQHDVHMRYVGHVFHSHRPMDAADVFAKGRYLNSELLERALVARA
ncbi:MAG: DUF1016 N-terminal domain-containing protein, partial [Myxococcales bacterium]|nr:DUF1016 N-terminal domain-containing protein [Myxococcales bacterium]